MQIKNITKAQNNILSNISGLYFNKIEKSKIEEIKIN